MPINAGYEYVSAEKNYLNAKTLEEKIAGLEEMIRTAPKHKGSENLLSELKTRLKKFRGKQEKNKKTGSSTKKSIRKEGYQCVLMGFPSSGKSSLLSKLTNARPKISSNRFTTKEPEIGTLHYEGIKTQIVDLPSLGSENFDIGIVNTADCILITLDNLGEMEKIIPLLNKAYGKRIFVFTKSDLLSEDQLRKLEATLKTKKINGLVTSCYLEKGIEELKDKIIRGMDVIRIYTKEPGKSPSPMPVVLPKDSCVKDVAESIRKGFWVTVKETRITGPSSKFPNQKVGLSHVLKDRDIVEFHTR